MAKQHEPCSPGCHSHVTHPCEKCGYMANCYEMTYVNITSNLPECEGWLNLFIGKYPIALVDNVYIADQIREIVPEMPKREK